MHHTLLKRSIIYTIVHFSLCATIATGCDWCKGSVDKSTIINIGKTPPEIPEPKEPAKKAEPDDPSPKGSLDDSGKEEGNDAGEEDEDLKKKIKEILEAEQQRLEKEEQEEQEKELVAGQHNLEGQDKIQNFYHPYGYDHNPQPSAPESAYDPPPAYTRDPQNSHFSPNLDYFPHNGYADSNQGCNSIFNSAVLNDLDKNPSMKQKMRRFYSNKITDLKYILSSWLQKGHMYKFHVRLNKLEQEEKEIEEEKKVTLVNSGLSANDKAKQLKNLFIKKGIINYEINHLRLIIKIIEEQNNKSDKSTNAETNLYPKQEYAPQFTTERLDAPWPPNYDQHGLINDKKLYPTLP
ncbi:hypothetical protein [Cardinium endosymbiont of Philonthus spinipes]|uniref:hypothetical protein n=1 Tax=Cardinium endosymbiont of Philonthus spinipes TaxID=3077941 RepID=UPI00313B993C